MVAKHIYQTRFANVRAAYESKFKPGMLRALLEIGSGDDEFGLFNNHDGIKKMFRLQR